MAALARRAEMRSMEDARRAAAVAVHTFRVGGHSAHTARRFSPAGAAAAVVLLDSGSVAFWTDKRKPERSGKLPYVDCIWCGGLHVRCANGKGYVSHEYLSVGVRSDGFPCMRARFVQTIVRSFPSLQRVPHCMPWDAKKFATWARTSGAITSGSSHAARFVLAVWCGESDAMVGLRFDAIKALSAWDYQHKAAFLAWCANPWWP